jgi:putative hydrolase of the HAD superfamily
MRYLIWDFDGTLATRKGLWSQTLADVARESCAGAQFSPEDFAPHLQTGFFWHDAATAHTHIKSADDWWTEMAPVLCGAMQRTVGSSYEAARRLLPQIRDAYLDVRRWHVFADVEPCLRAVAAQGWCNVMLTNHVPELAQILEGLGLAAHFAAVCNSADTGYEKPHPSAFTCMRAMLTKPETVWMIGDNYHVDIVGAGAASIPAVLVRKQHPDAEFFYRGLDSLPSFFAARGASSTPTRK